MNAINPNKVVQDHPGLVDETLNHRCFLAAAMEHWWADGLLEWEFVNGHRMNIRRIPFAELRLLEGLFSKAPNAGVDPLVDTWVEILQNECEYRLTAGPYDT